MLAPEINTNTLNTKSATMLCDMRTGPHTDTVINESQNDTHSIQLMSSPKNVDEFSAAWRNPASILPREIINAMEAMAMDRKTILFQIISCRASNRYIR
jgi:hypothetical protein